MTVFSGMEAIDAKEDIDQEITQEDITPILMDTLIGEIDLAEDKRDIDQMLIDEEKFNTAFEQLKALSASIEEFGLSKGVIKAVDPDGYLSANGIIPAYEELNDLPTKDEKAEAALESIGEKISAAWKKIKEFMASLWNKIKGFFSKSVTMLKNYEKILKNIEEKLSSKKEFDDTKAKDKKFKLVNKTDLDGALQYFMDKVPALIDALYKDIITVINEVKTTQKSNMDEIKTKYEKPMKELHKDANSLMKYIGIEVEYKDDSLIIKNKADNLIYSDLKSEDIKSHGYSSIDDVNKTIGKAIASLKIMKKYDLAIKELDNLYKDFNEIADDVIKNASNDEKANKRAKSANIVKKGTSFVTSFTQRLINANMKAIKASISVGNSTLSISK